MSFRETAEQIRRDNERRTRTNQRSGSFAEYGRKKREEEAKLRTQMSADFTADDQSGYAPAQEWQNNAIRLLNDYSNFASQWSSDPVAYEAYRVQLGVLNDQADSIRAGLHGDFDAIDNISLTQLAIQRAMEGVTPTRDFYALFGSQEEYDQSSRTMGYANKYAGKSYDQLMAEINGLDQNSEEYDWVSAYAPTTMTTADYDRKIADANERLEILNSTDSPDQWREDLFGEYYVGADAVVRRDIEREIEELQRNSWIPRRTEEYGSVSENPDFDRRSSAERGFTQDGAYNYINNINGIRSNRQHTREYQKYDFMTDEQIATYNYLYNTKGKKAAKEYLEYLDYDLNAQARERTQQAWSDLAGQNWASAVGANVLSVGSSVLSGVGTLSVLAQRTANTIRGKITGEYRPVDYNSSFTNPAAMTTAIRDQTAENIRKNTGTIQLDPDKYKLLSRVLNGKSLADVYQLGMSLADSAVSYAFAPILGKASTVILGGSSAAQTMAEYAGNGATEEQAITMGIISGAIEMITEALPLDSLLRFDSNTIAKSILKQIGTEGLEESAATFFGNIADILIMADKSKQEEAVAEYMRQGLSRTDAELQVLLDNAIQIGWDFVGGALSGGVMGGGYGAIGAAQRNVSYKNLYGEDISELINEALEINPENELAQKLKAKLDSSRRISGGQIYNLVQQNEAGMVAQDVANIQGRAMERLNQLGETGDVHAISAALAKQAAGQKLTRQEQTVISASKYGRRVANELQPGSIRSGDYTSRWARDIGTERINVAEYNRLVSEAQMAQEPAQTVAGETATPVAQTPSGASAQPVTDTNDGRTTGEDTNVPAKVADAQQTGPVTLESASKKYGAQAQAMVTTYNIGGGNQDVEKFASAYQAAYTVGKELGSLSYVMNSPATAYLTAVQKELAYDAGVDAAGIDTEYQRAYDMGRSLQTIDEVMGNASLKHLSDEQKKAAHEAGTKAAKTTATAQESRIAKKFTGNAVRRKGTVKGEGVTIEDLKKTFNDTQNKAYEILSKIAEVTGFNIVLYKSEANAKGRFTGAQGEFRHNDPYTIYLDINAGLSRVTDVSNLASYTMLRTFTHEFTHTLEYWNSAQYNELKKVVFAELNARGENVSDLIEDKVRRAGKDKNGKDNLGYEDASHEVVAEALCDILPDANFVQSLAEQHKGLFQELLSRLKEFIQSIKDHFASLSKNSPREARALKETVDGSVRYLESIVQMFDKAAIGAVENMQRTMPAETKTDAVLEQVGIEIDPDTNSVAPSRFSLRTWTESEYVTARKQAARALSEALDISVVEATKYIDDVNSIAALIADDKVRLDYEPNMDSGATVLKPNSEYKYTVDMSTLCSKRLLFTGTFDAIQKAMPNTVFDSEDIVRLREMMVKRGLEVACGICYVESTRREIGRITQEFIDRYKAAQRTGKPISRINSKGGEVTLSAQGRTFNTEPGYTPTLGDLNTTDIDIVKRDHREVYDAYLAFMNARGQAKPKLLETRAEYKGEILKHFKSASAVKSRNAHGGLRLQSFSDFEVPHMIDMMQVVMDMSRVGLKSQAYTKVPAFAEVFGGTGVKINLSLIAKGSGLDAKGNLIFDDVEGINHKEAFRIRDTYSENVGTILVGKNNAHIIAAMADPRIDFIIPFHKSSWKESLYDALGLTGYSDYTETQSEKPIDPARGKLANFDPSEYWDFTKTGDENAQIYLQKCREDGRIPKFPQFQSYPGYWKLLIDFKMYDNDGNGAPQQIVKPEYNMEAATRILNEYKGGHRSFPVAKDVVDDFVKDYEEHHNEGIVRQSARVSDEDTLDFLNEQIERGEYITTYKSMRLDGYDANGNPILHSPMATEINGKYENEYELGQWYQATEHPELIKFDKKNGLPYFELDKGVDEFGDDLGKVPARYNPYEHSSNYVINDQFKTAFKRPNLVVVEMRIPLSETTSGYQAQYAKDPVGWQEWKKGDVASALAKKGKERKVFLSRWSMPVRILSDAEVAKQYKDLLSGTGVTVPNNVVTPTLLKALEDVGVDVDYTGIQKFEELYAKKAAEREAKKNAEKKPAKKKPAKNVPDTVRYFARDNDGEDTGHDGQASSSQRENFDDEYPTYGVHWAVKDGIITKGEARAVWQAIADIEKRGFEAPKTADGDSFVSVGNALMIVDTDYRNPTIKTIFRINNDYDDFSIYAQEVLINAKGLRSETYKSIQAIENMHGEGTVDRYDFGVVHSNERENRSRKRRYGGENFDGEVWTETGGHRVTDDTFVYAKDAMWTARTLSNHIEHERYHEVNSEAYAVRMRLDDFLRLTAEPEITSKSGSGLNVEKERLDVARLSASEKRRSGILLIVDFKTGQVYECDGRHRAERMIEAGVETAPVTIATVGRSYNRAMDIIRRERLRGFDNSIVEVRDLIPMTRGYRSELIERFSSPTSENTLRYQQRGDALTDREVLEMAARDVNVEDLTDGERESLRIFNERLQTLNDLQMQRLEQGRIYHDNTFKKGGNRDEAAKAKNRMAVLDSQIARAESALLDVEDKAVLKTVLKKARRVVEQQTRQRDKDELQRWRERRNSSAAITKYKERIKADVAELNRLLLDGDKKRHVPENLKKAVADALAMVNMDTVGADERIAKYEALIARETDPDKIEAYTVTMENIRAQGEKIGQRLKDLRDAYEEISNSTDPDIANAYDPVIAGSLQELAGTIGDTSLRDMTVEQLEDVSAMYRMVLTRVRDANKTFLNDKRESISNLASRVVGEVRRVGGEHKNRAAILDPVAKFKWENQKPVYAMEAIGSDTMIDVFNELIVGEGVYATDVSHASGFANEKKLKYKFNSWDFNKKYRFESTSGIEFALTLEQIMSLYAYSKRNQAHEHLRLGGFVFDSNIETYKENGKKGKKSLLKYKVNTADAHQLTPEILANIIGKLTPEQRGFVDEMQEYLSTVMGAKGNEVTMKMYGVKLFKEKFYFPLKSAKQFMFEQNEVAGEVKIKNSGFTNKLVAKANNPIILSNFMDVWAGHVHDMSMYHSFVLPLEDFNRVFNYNSQKEEGAPAVSVKGTIQNAYGPAAVSYVKQLITDLNGGAITDPRETTAKALMSNFKKAAVFASMSVVIQQPSAIGRATALVDQKYFIGPKVDSKRHKALWAEVKKYAPVAIIKEIGYFDTGMGRSAQDFIKGNSYDSLRDKAKAVVTDSGYRDELISKLPALADELTWCAIWEAVKRETKAKNKGMDVNSEEFLRMAGKRFTEVITKTQVYDSVLARSGHMRSKSVFMNMWTAFMAEPTTTINMLEDGLRKGKRGNKKYTARVVGAVLSSVILNSLLVSLVSAMRDDDADETFLEKYLQSFATEMLDGINLLTYYPFLKDIWSALHGFDIERADMSLITRLIEASTKLIQVYSKDTSDMDEAELAAHQKDIAQAWWGVVDYVTAMVGLPVKNVRRDINAAINVVKTIGEDLSGRETTWGSLIDKVWDSVRSSIPVVGWLRGETAADKLYDATVSGDEAYQERLESAYETQSALDNAIRRGLRANDSRIWEAAIAWNDNNLTEYMRIAREIVGEGNYSQDNVVMAIRAEADAMIESEAEASTPKAKGYFTMDKFAAAISQGNGTMADVIRDDIIATSQRNGKTAEEAVDSFESSARSRLREMYLDGNITAPQITNALVDYCGYEVEDAEEYVGGLTFELEHPELDGVITYTQYQRWQANGEPNGVSLDVFTDVAEYRDDGTSDGAKSQEEVAAYINSLPISNNEKDALWCCFWKETTLHNAPWH